MKRILLTALLGLLAAPSWALVFTVTNTNNSGPGSFRQAVQDANTTPGPDQVEFNIAGPAPHVINLLSPVTFTDNQTTVDGSTQPANGYTGPSPHIVLQGQVTTGQEGLSIEGDGVALYGLYVRNFQYFGISVETTADNYVIGAPGRGNVISGNGYEGLSIHGHNGTVQANIIGLEPDGTTPEPNEYYGLSFEQQASYNLIGGTTPGERNIISANEYDGIGFGGNCNGGGDYNVIIGNYIGTDITGTLNRGNNYHGISIQEPSQYNIIGGSTPDSANLIAYNSYGAIDVEGVWTGICGSNNAEFNSIGINIMTCNDGPGINLSTNFFSGLTGNQGYAAPTVTSATPTQVTGTANPGDIIHIYNDDACPACQGEVYIGSAVADGLGNWVFNGSGISLTTSVIATATGPNGNTSEFSTCTTPPPPPCTTLALTGPAELCPGETAVLSTNVPVSQGSFLWSTGATTATVTVTGPGTYDVEVTQPGCPPPDQVQNDTIVIAPAPSLNVSAGPDTTLCQGTAYQLDATTPNAATYTWTNLNTGNVVASTATYTPTTTADYAVEVTASGFCSDTDSVSVTLNPQPVISGPAALCGTDMATYSASTAGTWSIVSSVGSTVDPAGFVQFGNNNSAVVSDSIFFNTAAGCSDTFVVTLNPTPEITGPTDGCGLGSTTLSSSFTGTWSLVSSIGSTIDGTGNVVFGNNPGSAVTDSAFVTTAFGCVDTHLITVNAKPVISGPAALCGTDTATYTASTAGTWSIVSSVGSTVDPAGFVQFGNNNSAVVSDSIFFNTAAGCSDTFVVTLNPTPEITGLTDGCGLGSTSLSSSITGGTWSLVSSIGSTIDGTGNVVFGNNPGTAVTDSAFVTTAFGCVDTHLITVNAKPVISGPAALCGTDTATYTASTAGTWSIVSSVGSTVDPAGFVQFGNNNSAVASDSIFFNTAAGCSDTFVVTLNPTPEITGPTDGCGLGSTTLSSSFAGTWSLVSSIGSTIDGTGNVVFGNNPGSAVTDSAFVTTAFGCLDTHLITVNAKPEISGPAALCGTDTATYSASTAGTWSIVSSVGSTVDPAGFVQFGNNNSAVASDSIFFNTAAGCSDTFVVTLNPTPEITGLTDGCGLGSTSLSSSITGGTWSLVSSIGSTIDGTGNVVFGNNPGSAVTDSAFVTTAFGCVDTHLITVNAKPEITGVTSICGTETATYTASIGGGTWSISSFIGSTVDGATGQVSFGNDDNWARIDSVFYATAAGCTDTLLITVNPVASISGPAEVCPGIPTAYTSSTGEDWSLVTAQNSSLSSSGQTATYTARNPGNAPGLSDSIYVTTAFGCQRGIAVSIRQAPEITGDAELCAGESTSYQASLGGSWALLPTTSGSFVDTATGDFTAGAVSSTTFDSLLFTAQNTCRDTFGVTVHPLPSFSIDAPATACFEATLAVPQDPAVEVMWSTGEMTPTITVTESGTYDAQRTNTSTGCQFSATHTVTIEAPEAAFSFSGPTCVGNPVDFLSLANSTENCQWEFGDGSTSTECNPTHSYTTAGSYEVSFTVGPAACRETVTQTLSVHPAPPVNVLATPAELQLSAQNTTTFRLEDATNISSYSWLLPPNADSLSGNDLQTVEASFQEEGTYTAYLSVTDQNGCTGADSATVVATQEEFVFVPNVFTPTGDGINDFLRLTIRGIESMQVSIYSRWGVQMHSENLNGLAQQSTVDIWDGTNAGEPAPEGVYVYTLTYVTTDGREQTRAGSVTVLR